MRRLTDAMAMVYTNIITRQIKLAGLRNIPVKNLTTDNMSGSNFGYAKFTLERCLDDVAELGLTKFELWGQAPHLHVHHTGAEEISWMNKALADRGLTMSCYTPEQVAYPVNIAEDDEKLRGDSLQFFKRAAEISSELNCAKLFVVGGWGRYDQSREEAWDRSVAAMREIVEYAAPLGVTCVTESLQPKETNLVLTAADVKRYMDDVDLPNLKYCLDIVAMADRGETPADHFKLYGDKIVHCHFQDGKPSGHLAWGDGNLPLAQYLRDMDELGYTGTMTPELTSVPYARDPYSALKRTVEAMKEVLAE